MEAIPPDSAVCLNTPDNVPTLAMHRKSGPASTKPPGETDNTELSQLVEQVTNTLPRELRDIIYQHLLISPSPWSVMENGSITSAPRPTRPLRTPRLSKYISRNIVPEWVVDEMTETFYRCNTFELSRYLSDDVLKAFLCDDLLGSRCAPGLFVRHLVFPVRAPRMFFDVRASTEKFFDQRGVTPFTTFRSKVQKLSTYIAAPRACMIEFVVQEHSALPMLHVFRLLAPTVLELKDAGFRVEVTRNESVWSIAKDQNSASKTVFTDIFLREGDVEEAKSFWEGKEGWGLDGECDSWKKDEFLPIVKERIGL